MKYLVFILLTLCTITFGVQGQQLSKKEIRSRKILSVTESETDLRVRNPKAVQESYKKYNRQGEIIEIIERDNKGIITLHESYDYDTDGHKTVEIQYLPNGKIKKRHIYKYENGLRTERLTYDARNRLIGRKKYIYEYNKK